MGKELEVKLLNAASLQQQVDVYIRAFETKDTAQKIIEYWKKKHFDNPIHPSYVFGVYDEERLVSINAYMPMHYVYNHKLCNVIQSCESGTIPEYRGKGIWSKVVRFAVDYFVNEGKYDFLIGFPNFDNSYGGFMKMKWNHDADVINFILIANGKEFVRHILNKTVASVGYALGIQKTVVVCRENKEYKVVKQLHSLDCVENGFYLKADFDFLLWKEKYKGLNSFCIADSNNSIIATCMYYLGEYKGAEVIHFCNPIIGKDCKSVEKVYAFAIKTVLKNNPGAAFVRAWAIKDSDAERIYKKIMFLRSKHHNPFITYQLKDDVVSADVLHAAKNWENISFLDLD